MAAMDDTLIARVEALEAELAAIRGTARPRPRSVDAAHVAEPPESVGPPVSDRRGVVKLLAASAVGAVAATALHGQQVAADDGDFVVLGDVNEATTLTEIHASDHTALYMQGEGGYGFQAWDALVVQGGLTSGRWALVHLSLIHI